MARRAGERFAAARREAGLTQYDLASWARLHVNTVSNLERGSVEPSILALGMVCLRLGFERIEFDESGYLPVMPARIPAPVPPILQPQAEPAMAVMHGTSFRERRLVLGLSLAELAGMARVHPNTLWNFERGRAAPSASCAWRLYRALGFRAVTGRGPAPD